MPNRSHDLAWSNPSDRQKYWHSPPHNHTRDVHTKLGLPSRLTPSFRGHRALKEPNRTNELTVFFGEDVSLHNVDVPTTLASISPCVSSTKVKDAADLVVKYELENGGGYSFQLNDNRLLNRPSPYNRWRSLPKTTAANGGSLESVLRAAWNYHNILRSQSLKNSLLPHIRIHFTKVEYSEEEYDEYLRPLVIPVGANLLQNQEVNVIVDDEDEDMYGISVSNEGTEPLFVSAMFFDNDFSIVSMVDSSSSSAAAQHLPPGSSVTMGYGPDGGDPWRYVLTERQTYDIGYIKVYISTSPFDTSNLLQSSPFEEEYSRDDRIPDVPDLDCEIVLIPVIQHRPVESSQA